MTDIVRMDTSEMNVLFVHSAIDDYPLKAEEFRVYAHIARRAGLGEAWPSIGSIAKRCRLNEDTARRCVHNLIAYRLIAVTERGLEGKTNLYRLTPFSAWCKPAEVLALQKAAAQAGKEKRAAKAATQGGLPNEGRGSELGEGSQMRGGGVSQTEGGGASQMRGDEVSPLKGTQRRDSKTPSTADAAGGRADMGNPITEVLEPQQPEQVIPSQVQDQATASAEPSTAIDLENVPGGGAAAGREPTEHQAMMGAIRSALYPNTERCADSIEKQIAQASKELRGARLGLDAPAGILAYLRREHAWRKIITPKTLVQFSADWANAPAQAASTDLVLPVTTTQRPIGRPNSTAEATQRSVDTASSVLAHLRTRRPQE